MPRRSKMKILFTNHDLTQIGGTQIWLETMALEMRRRGHEVTAACFLPGQFSDRLREQGLHVTTFADLADDYDLAIVNHNTCLRQVQSLNCPKVFTSHGPAHPVEFMVLGADAYVAVSEEVQAMYAANPLIDGPEVVRNPIDLERFHRKDRLVSHDVGIACKNKFAMKSAATACEKAGLTYECMHYREHPVEDPWNWYNKFDIAIASGRAAYEAMASGCSVLIYDVRSGEMRADGWVTPENIADLVTCNCSGRFNDYTWGTGHVVDALRAYEPSGMRWWAEEHHDVRKNADRYLSLAESRVAA